MNDTIYGTLYYDKILFETYYPILFTVIDKENTLYLCACCQHNKSGTKWLLTLTSPMFIIDLLENRITLRDAFLKDKRIQLTLFKRNEILEQIQHDQSDWDVQNSTSLPELGEYIDAEPDEFFEEIEYYSNKIRGEYDSIIPSKTEKYMITSQQIDELDILKNIEDLTSATCEFANSITTPTNIIEDDLFSDALSNTQVIKSKHNIKEFTFQNITYEATVSMNNMLALAS